MVICMSHEEESPREKKKEGGRRGRDLESVNHKVEVECEESPA